MAAPYREQYDRMKRWYDRFAALDQGRPHNVPSDNYLDEIYAFFMNCYHLKDWIKHDATVTVATKQVVEAHINSSRALKLCADICNSLKHLHLTSSRSGENPAFGRKQFGLALGTGPTTINLKYEIDTTGGAIDAFQLATDCIEAWNTFFSANRLT
ncbi:MAG: hypothetical protein P0120_06825 [Nitrospira sp.]|nr:hypothetical protein [Nitrospira sp.]